MKDRNLMKQLGKIVVEGEKDDDWQAVNCQSYIVHIMLPRKCHNFYSYHKFTILTIQTIHLTETRKMVDLEAHWSMPERPCAVDSPNEMIYEDQFSKLLDRHPVPHDYIKNEDVIGTEKIVKEF